MIIIKAINTKKILHLLQYYLEVGHLLIEYNFVSEQYLQLCLLPVLSA